MKYAILLINIALFLSCVKGPAIKFPENVVDKKVELPIFDIVEYKVDDSAIANRASQLFEKNPVALNVRGKKLVRIENDEGVTFKAGSVQFEIAKATGGEIFLDLARYTYAGKGYPTLKDSLVEEISKKYLKQYFPDINPKEFHYKGIKKIMNSTGQLVEKGQNVKNVHTEIANYILIYERRLNGFPVIGPGGKIRVYLSNDGRVIGHSKIWRQTKKRPKTEKPIVITKKIMRAFFKKHKMDKVKEIKVDELYLGYFADGRYSRQTTLKPVYIIGYKYGSWSKRVFEMYDAYTSKDITPIEPTEGDDKRQ